MRFRNSFPIKCLACVLGGAVPALAESGGVGSDFTIESAPDEGTTAVLPAATISVQQDVGAGN